MHRCKPTDKKRKAHMQADSYLHVWDDLSISKVQYIVDSRC